MTITTVPAFPQQESLMWFDYVLEFKRTRADGSVHTFRAEGKQRAESAMLAFTYCCTLWQVAETSVTYYSVALSD